MNLLKETIMDGPVTIGLVSICFAVCAVVVGVFTYLVARFQTKAEANKMEAGLISWIQRIEGDVSGLRTSLETIGNNVSYIRGRLEPNTPQKQP